MTIGFIETTVLTDYLLKKDGSESAARRLFERFDALQIPQFSWKEFKRGPLANFVWAYNKLKETNSFLDTVAALQRMSRSPRRYLTSTAIQALHTSFTELFSGATLGDLSKRYGEKANLDLMHADALRLEIKRAIYASWGRRRSLYGGPTQKLSCYKDIDLNEVKSRINIEPRDCPANTECCLRDRLRGREADLSAARAALKSDEKRIETGRRINALRHIEKHKSSPMTREECRRFGDAYFALFCPNGGTILTTNVRDIEPMASAVGIAVAAPAPLTRAQ